jgi:peptidoglycan/LPS O-acetylase OafA/YrhL
LAYLGEYSFPLWLVHSFFCYYYFQDIIYFPKWSPFIFMLLITMSLLSVVGIEYSKKRIRASAS